MFDGNNNTINSINTDHTTNTTHPTTNAITHEEYNILYKIYCDDTKTRKNELQHLFGVISSTLSTESLHITMGHPEYLVADENKDGFQLWKIVYAQHLTTNPQLNNKFQHNEIKEKFYSLHQKSNQTLPEYYEEFISCVRNFKELGIDQPDQEELAIKFLRG